MSWTKKITHPSEMLKKGDRSSASCSRSTGEEARRARLKQAARRPIRGKERHPVRILPTTSIGDDVDPGTVTKITNFGVFVELEDAPREALEACSTSPSCCTGDSLGDGSMILAQRPQPVDDEVWRQELTRIDT
jgi:hypothetical protein